jgi:Gliding motility associated protein GldN
MKNLFCAIFILITLNANAQFEDLINDKNVAWVAESSIDIRLDMLHDEQLKSMFEETKYGFNNSLSILKFQDQRSEQEREEGYLFFTNILLEAAKNKQITAYSDSLCHDPIDILACMSHNDTIVFSETEPPLIVKNLIQSDEIKLFRAHQITSYSPENGQWNSKTISIAPLKMVKDESGKFIAWKPIFWMKVDNKKANLNSSNITWAVRTRTKGIESDLQLNATKLHKKALETPMLHFLDLAINNKKMRLYPWDNWEKGQPYSLKDRQNIFTKIDTILVIDPITNEEKLKISESHFDVNSVNSMRLIQEWVWDNKRKSLSIIILGIAPLAPIKNEEGKLLFFAPSFYQRFDD